MSFGMGWILDEKLNIKVIAKEALKASLIIFIFSNIISYLLKPEPSFTRLPKMNVNLLDGSEYSVEKDKPLMIHFWATWCPMCKLEASNIEILSKKYEILSVVVNSGDRNYIQEYMKSKDLDFKVVNDKKGVWASKFHVKAYPTTFIYNKQGILKFTEVGYTTTVGLLARMKILAL